MKHSPLGPSQFKKRFSCPGSLLHEKNFGVPDDSEEAQIGTILHGIISYANEVDELKEDDVLKLKNSWDMEAIQRALNFQNEMIAKNLSMQVLHEEYLDLTFIHPEIGGGTLDFALVKPYESGYLIDWKFFQQKGLDEAQYNDQVILYAIGLMSKYELTSVTGIVYLPHVDGYSEHTWTHKELEKFEKEYRNKVETIKANPFWFKLGDHCKHCTAKALCPAQVQNALSVDAKAELNFPGPKLSDFLDRGEHVKKWFEALSQYAYGALMAGKMIPGYNLFAGRSSREFKEKDALKLQQALIEIGKMHKKKKFNPDDFWTTPEIKSPHQIEKLVGTSKPIKEELDKLIETKAGALVMRKVMEERKQDAQGHEETLQREDSAVQG